MTSRREHIGAKTGLMSTGERRVINLYRTYTMCESLDGHRHEAELLMEYETSDGERVIERDGVFYSNKSPETPSPAPGN